jgi:Na+-translocating ferredoxin:NAD+ oxidoreductase RNF subunit RnfB
MTDRSRPVLARLIVSLLLLGFPGTAALAQTVAKKLADVSGKTVPGKCEALDDYKERFKGICDTDVMIKVEKKYCSDFYSHIMAMKTCPKVDSTRPKTVESSPRKVQWLQTPRVESCIGSVGGAPQRAEGPCKKWHTIFPELCGSCANAANAGVNACVFLETHKGQCDPTRQVKCP